MNPRPGVFVVVVGLLLSCSPDAPRVASTAQPTDLPQVLATPGAAAPIPDQRLLEPLTALGPCKQPPDGEVGRQVEGLVLPDDAIVTTVADADPLTNVQGYIPQTPVQIRVFYQQHRELEVISVEDEGFEAEVLTEAGGYRTFVKAQAVCELGSVFVAIVSPVTEP